MSNGTARQRVISELYNLYAANGFITEDEALACFAVYKIPLSEIDSITEHLLGSGVIFTDDRDDNNLDEGDEDYTQSDYDLIFSEALLISPSLLPIIDYIRQTRPPQWREWANLMPQAKAGNQFAVQRLFDMYFRVVLKLALNEHKNVRYELDDLIQEGAMGLLRAISKYNSSLHGSFVSYFPFWVRQFMTRAVADKSRLIRIPVHAVEKMDAEMYTHIPLDQFSVIGDDGFVENVMVDFESETVDEHVDRAQLREKVHEILNALKPREGNVLRLRFGLEEGSEEKTLEEVGTIYNVTRERIRQIEARAIRKLQHPSRIKHLKDFY